MTTPAVAPRTARLGRTRKIMSSLSRDRTAVVVALTLPPATSAVLVPFRSSLPNTDAALVLVAVIVAVAAFGNRIAGLVAAGSAAAIQSGDASTFQD